jgi:hypothetical protein
MEDIQKVSKVTKNLNRLIGPLVSFLRRILKNHAKVGERWVPVCTQVTRRADAAPLAGVSSRTDESSIATIIAV